jgi:hypothetical protein
MEIPKGYRSTKGDGYCLRLVKSLYGHKKAPKYWFDYISKGFKKLGLVQSKFDQCLWYRGNDLMIVQYVDDCGISAPTQKIIDDFVKELNNLNFELTKEDTFAEFLGIKFATLKDGSIECTQRGLIKKTLKAAGMEDCNPNSTPALVKALGSDPEGEPMNEKWDYLSIVGMLLYLSTNTRPDIAMAVSQVCRFSNNPKKSHATAVKMILRYLKKTMNQGTIIRPTKNKLDLQLYVDSDYAGLYGIEKFENPDSVKSRMGYIIILGGWPLIWKTRLSSVISTSTCMAEYDALSTALKTLLPTQWMIKEVVEHSPKLTFEGSELRSTVHEDNQSAYYLATNQRISSRTKAFAVKWHWFWEQYRNGQFRIVKCDTKDQRADYLTKSLSKHLFESNRKGVQGW